MDPRDEVIDSGDALTDSSSDELADLQKEFDIRKQKIIEKKLQKKGAEKNEHEKQILRSPSPSREQPKSASQLDDGIKFSNGLTNFVAKRETKSRSNINRNSNESSSLFFSKLHESSKLPKKSIDYEKRIFLFEIPTMHNLDVNEKEYFSSLYIRKRYIMHEDLTNLFNDKKILRVDKVYAKINPPGFHEPDYANWCVIGIITNKSEPKLTKSTNNSKQLKYMKITIGDLNVSVDLMIFGDAFKKFWKLRVGDIIAVLNPNVNPWKPPSNGFNLHINDGVDSILEIGSARDFGYCSMVRKDQTRCTSVINTLKSDLCNYHQEIKYKQSQNKRMELSGSVNLKSPTNKHGHKQSMYLSTNKNGKISGGYLNFEKINQQTTNYQYEGGKIGDGFVNPKLMDNILVKRRKHNDSKNNELLEKKLLKLLNNSQFKKLGLIKNPVEQPELSINKSAFNSSTLNKIGFDPISNSVAGSVHKSPQKLRNELSSDLKELYEISSRKQSIRKLTSSKADQISKKNKWDANLRSLEDYKQRYNDLLDAHAPAVDDTLLKSPLRVKNRKIDLSDSDSENEPGPRLRQPRNTGRISNMLKSNHTTKVTTQTKPLANTGKSATTLDSVSSDSEIEISFDNPTSKENYNKLINKSL